VSEFTPNLHRFYQSTTNQYDRIVGKWQRMTELRLYLFADCFDHIRLKFCHKTINIRQFKKWTKWIISTSDFK
jgi:hypothetical protein